MTQDFLVELGTEELPPTALKNLSNSFAEGIASGLSQHAIAHEAIHSYATPRRLAVVVRQMHDKTEAKEHTVWGPPISVAYDADNQPTKAAEAFARKNGLSVDALSQGNDGKADKLVCTVRSGGEAIKDLMAGIVADSLSKLPIPKRMRWGASRVEFVRPVHWLVMMHGSDVIEGEVLGLSSSNVTRGHRFHHDQPLPLSSTDDYLGTLEKGYVIADYQRRQDIISSQIQEQAQAAGGQALVDQDLLDEVTSLVEWPVALTGKFEQRFLEVPAEALIYSMKEHQKYFPVVNDDNQLLPCFITVSNIQSNDPSQVIDGNERVIRPRLSDAAFFFETDKKSSLTQFRERLQTIVFQAKLGTVYDKTCRIDKLSAYICQQLSINAEYATTAAQLCKSDLVSDMVGEFDKMQGVAGYYYALNEGLNDEVAIALKEHYQPKFAGDALPSTEAGLVVSLADRVDTLTGIFGIGEKPSGSKDPFALRRASLAVLRIMVEKQLPLDLAELLEAALALHGDNIKAPQQTLKDCLTYMMERFKAWYEDRGVSPQEFQSVAAMDLSNPLDFHQRITAVQSFNQLDSAEALAAANKRVSNILAKANPAAVANQVDESLLQDPNEEALYCALKAKYSETAPLLEQKNYQSALTAVADLKGPIDDFFDNVMVMADEESLKNNRLALLKELRTLFLGVADISLLST